jgi:hypothetical protein
VTSFTSFMMFIIQASLMTIVFYDGNMFMAQANFISVLCFFFNFLLLEKKLNA